MNTALARSAEDNMTGMLEVYSNLIGYTAVNPRYFVETIGMSTCIPRTYTSIRRMTEVIMSPNTLGSCPALNRTCERSTFIAE